MAIIFSKDDNSTVIITLNKKYTIEQQPSGIQLSIGPIKTGRLSDELEIRLWLPAGTKSQKETIEDTTETEIIIWTIPINVLEDIQERTNQDIKIEDLSEYDTKSKPGKEFFIRIKGYILISAM